MFKAKVKTIASLLAASMVFAIAIPANTTALASTYASNGSAKITTTGTNTWSLENKALKTTIAFSKGSIDMTSFYNKTAGKEYLTGSGERELFSYVFSDGSNAYAKDGNWSLENAKMGDISLYNKSWGEQLDVTLTCIKPVKMQVKLEFQIYNGTAGLRYQCYVKNNTTSDLIIKKSNVLELNFQNNAHTAYYVPNMIWASTTGELRNTRDCIMDYNTGDGWCMVPELNWKTANTTDSTNPAFGGIYAWVNGEQSVRFSTNPAALQLELFPNEEKEYLAVNLTVFQGDELDGRASVEDHFTQRYKYWDRTTQLSVNDWEWFSSGKRTDDYYRNTVVPQALAGGFDRINVDDLWNVQGGSRNGSKDGTTPDSNFTTDLASLSSYINSKGLQIGYWFSPSGTINTNRTTGVTTSDRDLADWSQVQYKINQMEDILIGQYHCNWTQIDLQQLAANPNITSYSHPSDSSYRKAINLEKYENYFTHKYPSFAMRITNELDTSLSGDSANNDTRNCGLIDLADNGMVSALGNFSDGDINLAFNSYGYFPMSSVFFYFSSSVWHAQTEWMYQFLASRESVIYKVPDSMDAKTLALMKTFNTWRKNPRIKAVLNSNFRPVETDNSYAWMNVTPDKTQAMLIATDAYKTTTSNFTAKLRWLNDKKTYLVQDVTLKDDGTFTNSLVTRATGAQLKSKGIAVNYKTNTSNGKAYWIQEDNGAKLQVAYADSSVNSYKTSIKGNTLTVTVTSGTANASAKIAVYDRSTKKEQIKSCKLSSKGTGTFTFNVTNPKALK